MPVFHRPCVRLVLPSLVALVAATACALAQGTPRSVGECERLKNDLAYNQCLAMFGPPARNVAGGDGLPSAPPVPGDPVLSAAAAAAATESARAAGLPIVEEPELAEPGRRGRRGRRAHSGRQSAVFAIATGSADAAPRRRSRHRRRH